MRRTDKESTKKRPVRKEPLSLLQRLRGRTASNLSSKWGGAVTLSARSRDDVSLGQKRKTETGKLLAHCGKKRDNDDPAREQAVAATTFQEPRKGATTPFRVCAVGLLGPLPL